jgi:tRNA U34 5-methylaminomethyl-2-thiouridine-forming methyltransferase MnmC
VQNANKTADGSFTLYSERFGEHYHSVTEGALRESLYKHVYPAMRYSSALTRRSIGVLDICFGLGYNTLCTIFELTKAGYDGFTRIVSPEADHALIAQLESFAYPDELERLKPILRSLIAHGRYESDRFGVELVIGDAAAFARELNDTFDIVYHDPFSLNKNAALWSAEYFGAIYRLLAPHGVLTTYSASHNARAVMRSQGFLLYTHDFAPEDNLRRGTIAAKNPIGAVEI